MASMLQAIIDDPYPGAVRSFPRKQIVPASSASLSAESAQALRARLVDAYDPKNLGWGTVHKFLDWNVVEYCMSATPRGGNDDGFERMARETLGAQRNLIDPVWGGVYQYSTDGDWKHPHYEKLLQFQAENLRIYAAAYARWGDPEYLKDAKLIRRLHEGIFDEPRRRHSTPARMPISFPESTRRNYFALDDDGRRKKGIPRVDTHVYSRENGWAIQALATSLRRHRRKGASGRCRSGGELDHRPARRCRAEDFPTTRRTLRVLISATRSPWAPPSSLSTR